MPPCRLSCPGCKCVLTLTTAQQPGTILRCPRCKKVFRLAPPRAASSPAAAPAPAPVAAAPPPPPPEPPAPPRAPDPVPQQAAPEPPPAPAAGPPPSPPRPARSRRLSPAEEAFLASLIQLHQETGSSRRKRIVVACALILMLAAAAAAAYYFVGLRPGTQPAATPARVQDSPPRPPGPSVAASTGSNPFDLGGPAPSESPSTSAGPPLEKDAELAAFLERTGGKLVQLPGQSDGLISYLSAAVTDANLKGLGRFQDITWLSLAYTRISAAGLKEVARLKRLERLDLHGAAGLTDEAVAELAACTSLRELDLRQLPKVTGAALHSLDSLRQLHTLALDSTRIEDVDLIYLQAFPHLESLDLSNTLVTSAGMRDLAAFTSLRVLRLDSTAVTGEGLRDLAPLGGLQVLYLRGVRLQDDDLKALTRLRGLRELSLAYTPVSDASIGELAALISLRKLDLEGARISPAGAAALRKALPDCTLARR